MMTDIRCVNTLHFRFDPETGDADIKCRQCTQKMGRPIHHRVNLVEVMDAYKRGETFGLCGPASPRFVHWRVTGN